MEGHVVAWSLDRTEEVGLFYTVSCRTTLQLESATGERFAVELAELWRAITECQVTLTNCRTEDERAAAQKAWADAVEDTEGAVPVTNDALFQPSPENFAKYRSPGVFQSVILAGRQVAISGVFEALPVGYPRGEASPVFRLREGTIDDFTLDGRWKRSARLHHYAFPLMAFFIASVFAFPVFVLTD